MSDHASSTATLDAGAHAEHTHQHQFDSPRQQHEAAALGMWCFLATEVLFFGGVFCAYAIYRHAFPDEFVYASHRLYWWVGGLNTGVLLCSSLTAALAVRAAHTVEAGKLFIYLILTALLGSTFLVVKATEYYVDYRETLVPGSHFSIAKDLPEEALPTYDGQSTAWASPYMNTHDEQTMVYSNHVELFFIFYFIMTGIHATHMIIGITIMVIVAFRVKGGRYKFQNHNSVEMLGLYWHFVDIVWIFLFPLLYLIK